MTIRYYSQKAGNWSDAAAMWNDAANGSGAWHDGAGAAADGVFFVVRHAVAIDCDIGSVSGGGVKRIDVHYATGTVSLSRSPSDTVARTIVFGSTGTDPKGTGTDDTPGDDATMFGIHAGRGTIDLEGSAAYPLTITTANDSSPWYLCSNRKNLGASSPSQPLTLKYVNGKHVGTNVTRFLGIDCEHDSGWITIDHCKFEDLYQVLIGNSTTPGSITNNFFTGVRSDKTIYITVVASQGFVNYTITDNTETAPAISGNFCYVLYRSTGLTFARNAVWAGSTYARTGFYQGSSGTSSDGNVFSECLIYQKESGTMSPNPFGIRPSVDGTTTTISKILSFWAYQGVSVNASDNTKIATVSGCYIKQDSRSQAGQGAIVSYTGTNPIHNNVLVFTSNNNNIAFLVYQGSGSDFDHNTIIYTGSGYGLLALCIGDGSILPAANMRVRSNIVQGWQTGIKDCLTSPTLNAYLLDTPPGAGVHHNDVYGCTYPYEPHGGANFTDGTHSHPDAVYSDLAVDPQFVDTTLTPQTWDVSLGGAGTIANIFDQLSRRSGFGGTYDSRYTVANLHAYLMAGFQVKEPSLNNAGHDGATIGACGYLASASGSQGGFSKSFRESFAGAFG